MAETVEEISYDYEEEGKLVRRELKKEVLTKGAWATVMFLFEELDRKTEQWGEPKVSIVRFKKSGGNYRRQSSFNISSEKQARQIMEVLDRWYGAEGKAAAAEAHGGKSKSKQAGDEPAAAKGKAAKAPAKSKAPAAAKKRAAVTELAPDEPVDTGDDEGEGDEP